MFTIKNMTIWRIGMRNTNLGEINVIKAEAIINAMKKYTVLRAVFFKCSSTIDLEKHSSGIDK